MSAGHMLLAGHMAMFADSNDHVNAVNLWWVFNPCRDQNLRFLILLSCHMNERVKLLNTLMVVKCVGHVIKMLQYKFRI